MKDNKKMSLNIQLFAEKNDGMVTNTETLEENENAQKEAQNQKSEAENKGSGIRQEGRIGELVSEHLGDRCIHVQYQEYRLAAGELR